MDASGEEQRTMAQAQGLIFFVSENGLHGSSTLDASRAKGGVEASWEQVWAFLAKNT
jgi:hypothetical protein